jgi:hypothetical protein
LRELLADCISSKDLNAQSALYDTLFPKLRQEFNGSMFDDDLDDERKNVRVHHLKAIQRFLNGDDVRRQQGSLGLWAYNFGFIPIELISSIYEKFLKTESDEKQRQQGAYYTPRFLAEMTLDVALEGRQSVDGLRFLDPACGSGIFLVLMFNRLIAEWRSRQRSHVSPTKQALALRERLAQLRGVDLNPTACRITCFSLYLAYLDQFDPPDVRSYMKQTGEKLPHLLQSSRERTGSIPVVWERDFLAVADNWHDQFEIIVGNPPWAGRGTKQIAQSFIEKTPKLLAKKGKATLIAPSKILFNKTDKFQTKWLCGVTLEKVVQLADYSFILFNEAKSPATIMRFANTLAKPDHEVEYVTPKVTRTDLRDGVIVVSPQDRKWIRQTSVIQAAKQGSAGDVWKMQLWGTPRDQKLLDYLLTFPKLEHLTGTPTEFRRKSKRWCVGVGFQPLRLTTRYNAPKRFTYSLEDDFIHADQIKGLLFAPRQLTDKLGDYVSHAGYVSDKLRRAPVDQVFTPPLVLMNKGFTSFTFIDYPVRFQDALRSISGPKEDTRVLMLLAAFLRSKLARYYIFHTAASLATERDQVHLEEALQLPFFLPDHDEALPGSQELMDEVVSRLIALKSETEQSARLLRKKLQKSELDVQAKVVTVMGFEERVRDEWRLDLVEKTLQTQQEIDPLIYQYFGLTDQDIALVEDTWDIFDKSDTPPSLEAARQIPTLQAVNANGMSDYAETLAHTLNGWATGALRSSATGSVDTETGLGLLELRQTSVVEPYRTKSAPTNLAISINRLQQSLRQRTGSLEYQRSGWYFDNSRIIIVKPARRGEWTRTAALNDAVEIYAHIAQARQSQRL